MLDRESLHLALALGLARKAGRSDSAAEQSSRPTKKLKCVGIPRASLEAASWPFWLVCSVYSSLESVRRQFGVADRVLNVLVASETLELGECRFRGWPGRKAVRYHCPRRVRTSPA
jgi:hypothetical protein